MILNALWSGALQSAPSVPCRCQRLLSVFPFPILLLSDSSTNAPRLRVFTEDHPLGPGLTLGDALAEELGLEVPYGACIVICGGGMRGGLSESIELAAEILYSAIVNSAAPREISLFDWALRSFTGTWRTELCADAEMVDRLCREVTGRVSGWRPGVGALHDYFLMLEPDFVSWRPDETLSTRLSAGGHMRRWAQSLCAAWPGWQDSERLNSGLRHMNN